MIKIKKIIFILLMFMTLIMISNESYAGKLDDIIESGDNFINVAEPQSSPINKTELQNTSKEVFSILYPIAVVILLGVGMIIGIKFIVGSVEEQAKIKEILVPYVVGAIVIFGAFTIWKLVIDAMQSI